MFQQMKEILAKSNFKLFTRPYELNIVGVRSTNTLPNLFDDKIHVFYKTNDNSWDYHVFNATTDPGTFWLKNPLVKEGTAILPSGQYENAYSLGLHKGQYKALVQSAPITIIRDFNRDNVLDFWNGTKYTGMFGINIHRASVNGVTKTVDKYSAGCQVFENIYDYDSFMALCEQHKNLYGNKFTYTLVDYREIQKASVKFLSVAALTLAASIAAGCYYYNDN